MASVRYTAILKPQASGGFHAFCPSLRGCHSQGDTVEETLAHMREAMEVYIESVEAHGEPMPKEDLLIHSLEISV